MGGAKEITEQRVGKRSAGKVSLKDVVHQRTECMMKLFFCFFPPT